LPSWLWNHEGYASLQFRRDMHEKLRVGRTEGKAVCRSSGFLQQTVSEPSLLKLVEVTEAKKQSYRYVAI